MKENIFTWGSGSILSVLLGFLSLNSVSAQSVYVWSFDGSITQYTGPGSGNVIADTGSSYNGPVGLAVDNQGYLYSGNPSDSTITKYAAGGVSSPYGISDSISGLAFNNSATLYGTSPNYSAIVSGPGLGTNIADYTNSKLNFPTSLAFNNGDIFAANNGGNFESNSGFVTDFAGSSSLNSDGNTIEKFSSTGEDLGTFATGLDDPYGLAFDTYGDLFVSNVGNSTIDEFYYYGGERVFANSSNGLSDPEGLAFDNNGNLYVVNTGDGTIEEFYGEGYDNSIYASGLDTPSSIAISNVSLPATIPEPSTLADVILASGGFLFIVKGRSINCRR